MKSLITLMALFFVATSAFAAREVQNGGTGLRVENGFLTYYSMQGIYRQPVEMADRIQGLDLLLQEIMALPMETQGKMELIARFDFTQKRSYYRLSQGDLSPELRNKIIDDYAELMKVPHDQVVVFAVTNTTDKSTVLFPEFFALRPTEQAAMIVHESLWLTPDASYEKVISGEQITQAYLEDPASPPKFYRFIHLLNGLNYRDNLFKVRAGYYFDLKHKRLAADVLTTQRILLKDLLGEKFLKAALCSYRQAVDSFDFFQVLSQNLYLESRFNYELKDKSLFFTAFFEQLRDRGIVKLDFKLDCTNVTSLDGKLESLYLNLAPLLSQNEVRLPVTNGDGKIMGNLTLDNNFR